MLQDEEKSEKGGPPVRDEEKSEKGGPPVSESCKEVTKWSNEELCGHINYAYETANYGYEGKCWEPGPLAFWTASERAEPDQEQSSEQDQIPRDGKDPEHRSRITKCCYPREKDLSCCCVVLMPYRAINRTLAKTLNDQGTLGTESGATDLCLVSCCQEAMLCTCLWCCGGSSRRQKDYELLGEGQHFDSVHKKVMETKLRELSCAQWEGIRTKIDYLGKDRFENIFTTLGSVSLIQTLGVIFLFIEIDSRFNENLLYDALWMYTGSICLYMFIVLYATVRDATDPFRHDHQPGKLKLRDIVHYIESTNFSYRLFQTLMLFYVCISIAYFAYFVGIIDCQIALSQGKNQSTFFFFNRNGTCIDTPAAATTINSTPNTTQASP